MDDPTPRAWTRRRLLQAGLIAPAAIVLARLVEAEEARPRTTAAADEPELDPTPPCADSDDVTPRLTAGPFYSPNSPVRQSLLEPGVSGDPVVVVGRVFSKRCRPLPNVLLDVWHADGDGEYDNEGFRCRGHQFTDRAGRFRLVTVVPGLYPGRTRHFHVRLQAPKSRILTTQLYFPNERRNEDDFLFRRELLLEVKTGRTRKLATFDFVLDA